jgi:outer membrane murein-binding lipoprotein Lpp
MKWMICCFAVLLSFMLAGCSNRTDENVTAVREILELAKEDKVAGNLRVHLNGGVEAGMKEGFYFGSPGSVVQGELEFRMKDVTPKEKENVERPTE